MPQFGNTWYCKDTTLPPTIIYMLKTMDIDIPVGLKKIVANDFTILLKGLLGQNSPEKFEMQKLFTKHVTACFTKLSLI